MQHIIKREGHKEKYDQRKTYASVYAAALNCHYSDIKSEKIAKSATIKINSWIRNKKLVYSEELREQILKIITDRDVELMYRHHYDLS